MLKKVFSPPGVVVKSAIEVYWIYKALGGGRSVCLLHSSDMIEIEIEAEEEDELLKRGPSMKLSKKGIKWLKLNGF